jgi:hypothetical protein
MTMSMNELEDSEAMYATDSEFDDDELALRKTIRIYDAKYKFKST